MSKKILYIAQSQDHGIRMDQVLTRVCKNQSRSQIQALIIDQYIQINGTITTKISHKVKLGDEFNIHIPFISHKPQPQSIPLDILYEDNNLLVINKPAGMVVHPAPGHTENTLVNALLFYCGSNLSTIAGIDRPGIVHRLDKDTSGCIVIAKNDTTHIALSNSLSKDKKNITRIYYAVVWGIPALHYGTVEGYIGRSLKNRKKMTLLTQGNRYSLTYYKIIKKSEDSLTSLLECKLETGRTHQIRVHMSHIGHSIIGDCIYGSRKKIKNFNIHTKKILQNFKRQALHAKSLRFFHPQRKKYIVCQAPLPYDILSLLKILKLS